MRRLIILFLVFFLMASCNNGVKIGDQYFKSSPKHKIITDKETGHFKIFPGTKSIAFVFNLPIKLDSNYEHIIDKNGIILKGKTAGLFTAKNRFAEFSIPPEIEFEYIDKAKSYVFKIPENKRAKVVSSDITYNIREFLMFNEGITFTGNSDTEYSFYHDGKEIIFIKNDNPVWDSSKGLDYHFYSSEYRDEIERDIIKNETFHSPDVFKEQFANHEGYGMQSYMGSWFFIKFDTNTTSMRLVSLSTPEEVVMNFKSMKVSRTDVSSYENKLVIDIKVNQDNQLKDGTLHLIVPSDELNNIRRILNAKETMYLVFRMGRFSDFTVSGSGIIYYSYDKKQLDPVKYFV